MANKRESNTTVNVRLPAEAMAWAREIAKLAGVSVEQVVCMVTAMYVVRYRDAADAVPSRRR